MLKLPASNLTESANPLKAPAATQAPGGLDAFFFYHMELKQRLRAISSALESIPVPYALIGGFAVAHHVGAVDPGMVRTTRDIDLLMHLQDITAAAEQLPSHGFRYRCTAGVHLFLDGEARTAGEAVHVIPSGVRVRPEHVLPAPGFEDTVISGDGIRVIGFPTLVRMKLTSFRTKDQMHLRDMIEVGLLPGHAFETLPEVLHGRLRQLLDNPE